MPFGHIWSLSVEEHSYVLLSIIAMISRATKWPAKWLIAACTLAFAACGIWYWSQYSGSMLEFNRWPHTEVSAFGIFLSALLLLVFANLDTKKVPAIVMVSLFVVGVLMHWWSVPAPLTSIVGIGCFALAVNLLHLAPQIVKGWLSVKPLRVLGMMSFSLYLWQQPFYLASRWHLMPTYLAFGCALVAGAISYYCLERPARDYLNRVWGAQKKLPPIEKAATTG